MWGFVAFACTLVCPSDFGVSALVLSELVEGASHITDTGRLNGVSPERALMENNINSAKILQL